MHYFVLSQSTRVTDGQNYDSQDRASVAASRGKNHHANHIHDSPFAGGPSLILCWAPHSDDVINVSSSAHDDVTKTRPNSMTSRSVTDGTEMSATRRVQTACCAAISRQHYDCVGQASTTCLWWFREDSMGVLRALVHQAVTPALSPPTTNIGYSFKRTFNTHLLEHWWNFFSGGSGVTKGHGGMTLTATVCVCACV